MNSKKIIIAVIIIVAALTGAIIAYDRFLNYDLSKTNLTKTNMKQALKKVRPMVAAGNFYPSNPAELNKILETFLSNMSEDERQIKAVLVPHAGYVYSGQVAADAFGHLAGKKYKKVWVIGPSHYVTFSGAAIPDYTNFQTPLGEIKVADISQQIAKEKNFKLNNEPHLQEHAVEIELPFLQKIIGDFELVPIVIGNQTTLEQLTAMAETLKKYFDDETLIVISCDFIHYGPNYGYAPFKENYQDKVKQMDNQVISFLLNYQSDNLFDYLENTAVTNDGGQVLTWLAEFFKDTSVKGELISYNTSGQITGDKTNSVSYASLLFIGQASKSAADQTLTKEEKDYLLKLARQSLDYFYQNKKLLEVDPADVPERLKVNQGVFVTLMENNELRGCIGYIEPVKSIYQSVIDNAVSAAVNDGRFLPVTKDELSKIKIDISVLSVPVPRDFPAQTRASSLKPLIDGVVLEEGRKRSTYLPQVWEDLKDPEEFLNSLCQKGGWNSDCWESDEVKLYTYQAEVFGEE